jgi:integrase
VPQKTAVGVTVRRGATGEEYKHLILAENATAARQFARPREQPRGIGEAPMNSRSKIGLRQIGALQPGQTIWDASLPGFGARRQKSDAVSYVLYYRNHEGRQRWYTIGRHGAPWLPDTARNEARKLLGDVAKNSDPAADKRSKRRANTVAELCDLYLDDALAGRLLTRRRVPKKHSTLSIDRGRIERHIKPLLGRRSVTAVTREDIDDFLHDVAQGKTATSEKTARKRGFSRVRGGRGTATRTVGLLGAIFTYAVKRRMRPDNPVLGVVRFADGKRERRLTDDEYRALGNALDQAEADCMWPAAVAAARFLALTGWRRGEALNLRWNELDLIRGSAFLGDTKTGRSTRALSNPACELLKALPRVSEWVFPASRGDGPVAGFPKFWRRIAKLGELPSDITPNVLRHSFQSLAADLGYSELTIGTLVGHKKHSVTSRYVHGADAVLLAAADAVAIRTSELMKVRSVKRPPVIALRRAG